MWFAGKKLISSVGCLILVASTQAQGLVYSTHDWQGALGSTVTRPDSWADTATPGNGWTYSVGTTRLDGPTNSTAPATQNFSNFECFDSGVTGFAGGSPRQVVVLQATDPAGALVWQRYFFGSAPNQPATGGFDNFGRRISVAPASTLLDTRIAICGDTYDWDLPLGLGINPISTLGWSAGFIAVYNGNGLLLWSYHFFGEDTAAGTAVTDVSIRFDPVMNLDVVTYCGTSSNGNYMHPSGPGTANSSMTPFRPFAGPASGVCGVTYAGGATHNSLFVVGQAPEITQTGNWDGFVGRLTANHNTPTVATREFHSIVGGGSQDGLFSLTELDDNRFAVVGQVDANNATPGAVFAFPLTRPYFRFSAGPICPSVVGVGGVYGVLLIFNAEPTLNGGPLELEYSTLVGSAGDTTVARDLLVRDGWIYVVGSTNDTSFDEIWTSGATGPNRGFLVAIDQAPGLVDWVHTVYTSGGSDSGVVGIEAWDEYDDHFTLVGWVSDSGVNDDIELTSIFHDHILNEDSTMSHILVRMRNYVVASGGSGDEKPGAHSATIYTTAWSTTAALWPLGEPEGGGIAVDERGLVTFVGRTTGVGDYPIFGGGLPPSGGHVPGDPDAIRSVVDMLPAGVCRTDGTGTCVPAFAIGAGYDGGTTPVCALSLVGGVAQAGGSLKRMFIDFRGQPVGGQSVAIHLDRPPESAAIFGGLLQIGFPAPTPILSLGIELWATGGASNSFVYPNIAGSIVEPLWGAGGLPGGSGTFTFQFLFLMPSPLCGNIDWAASPAMMVGY